MSRRPHPPPTKATKESQDRIAQADLEHQREVALGVVERAAPLFEALAKGEAPDPRDARIAELAAEIARLRELVRFLEQYRPR
jgi:hypothetical protein